MKKEEKKGKSNPTDEEEEFSDCSSESSGEDTADPDKAKKLLFKKLEKQSEDLVNQISQSISQSDPMSDAIKQFNGQVKEQQCK